MSLLFGFVCVAAFVISVRSVKMAVSKLCNMAAMMSGVASFLAAVI